MSGDWGRLEGIRPIKLARFLLEEDDADPVRTYMRQYGTSESNARLACDIAKRELRVLRGITDKDIGLYIGIPFCRTRCLYCSFVTNFSNKALALIEDYLVCLKKEITYTAEIIKQLELNVKTVYIGGGTPTTLTANQLEDLINHVKSYFLDCDEFTVEAGRPDTLDSVKLNTLYGCDVDRICINPQTMNNNVLEFIGRRHTSEDIIKCFYEAKEIGFKNINMDLIAGLPSDTLPSFEASVNALLDLAPEGITVHTMSIKRGSRLNEQIKDYELTDGNEVARMVDVSRYYLQAAGYQPYYLYRQKNILGNLENVGYAKDGLESLYNIMIMEEVSTIAAVGAGSVTKTVRGDKIERIFNVKEPQDYIARIDEMLKRKDALFAQLGEII